MNKLYRFSDAGRYLGDVIVDRPMEQYDHRTDVTDKQPPAHSASQWPYFVNNEWMLRNEKSPTDGTFVKAQ